MSTPSQQPAPFASAVALLAALRSGELSASEAAEHFLGRIAAHSALGAFVTVTTEGAREEARAADARLTAWRAAGKPAEERGGGAGQLPELLGLPIAHKDIVDVAGAPTSSGSAALPPRVAAEDHPVVAGLRSAGTVSLGKTQVPEFGLTSYSENLIAPPARNPLDSSLTPGGSSGGSAAAVAAGLLPFAPGSDGGGSIRIPALACGLVGLKPGLGAVAGDVARGYEDSFGAPLLTVSGPLARTAEDAALLMDAMAEPRSRGAVHGNHRGGALEAVRRAGDLAGLTIAASTASPFDAAMDIELSPAARAAFVTAADRLSALGHRVAAASFHYDPEYFDFFTAGWISGLSLLSLDEQQTARLAPLTREMRARALASSRSEHRETGARLHGFAREVREAWGATDIVLTPGLASSPPPVGAFLSLPPDEDYRKQCAWTPYTSMVNVSGLPAIAVPVLADPAGLPVGVQLIGRPGSEPQLLALAQQLTGGVAFAGSAR